MAATQSWGIGKNGQLPWNLPGDMAFFKTVTSTTKKTGSMNAVIMGRKTWEVGNSLLPPLAQIVRDAHNGAMRQDQRHMRR